MCSTSSRDVLNLPSTDHLVAEVDDLHPDLYRLVARHPPGYDSCSLVSLGEGLDNVAWLVNDELIVRQAKIPDPDAIRREAALLDIVGRYATLLVPHITFSDPDRGVLAYRSLPGQPLLDLPDADTVPIAEPLGEFLTAIHGIPRPEVESLVERDDEPLARWLDEAREGYARIAGVLPASARCLVEPFLAEPTPPEPDSLTFCHNDLGAEHILVDPVTMRITGIIDWTDAAITDPVRDLALLLRDFGPDVLDRVLATCRTHLTPDAHARLLFYARCKLIEDIAYGLETGSSRYLDAGLAHLDWTFGPDT